MVENKKTEKKVEKKIVDTAKKEKLTVENEKINELKIELLKSGSKRQRIKREIARLLTLQNTKMREAKTLLHQSPKQSKIAPASGEKK